MADDLTIIGKSLTKPDAYAKVSGQTKFADDLAPPRMVYGRILRSPHPHARILSVDTSRARALPGVLAVITGDDLPVKFGILPVSQDEEALAREKVRYVGDPIAAVAATMPQNSLPCVSALTRTCGPALPESNRCTYGTPALPSR